MKWLLTRTDWTALHLTAVPALIALTGIAVESGANRADTPLIATQMPSIDWNIRFITIKYITNQLLPYIRNELK